MLKRSKLTIFVGSVVLVVVIAISANQLGHRVSSGETFRIIQTNPLLYLRRSLNEYQFNAPTYRAMIYAYWYALSLILSYLIFTLSKRLTKAQAAKEEK